MGKVVNDALSPSTEQSNPQATRQRSQQQQCGGARLLAVTLEFWGTSILGVAVSLGAWGSRLGLMLPH